MKKIKKSLAVAAIAAIGCIAGVYGLQNSEKESKSALTITNIEALSRGEVTVVGCKKASGCSCYIFDGSGTLVGKEKIKLLTINIGSQN